VQTKRARIAIAQFADCQKTWNWISGGVPVDFAGCTAVFDLRSAPSDVAPLISLSTTPSDSGSIVLGTADDGNAGLVQLNFSKAATSGLLVSMGHGDLLVTFPYVGLSEHPPPGPTWLLLAIDAEIFAGSTY
jgi:hypothetical protein